MKKEQATYTPTSQKQNGQLSIINYIKLNGKLPTPSYLNISQRTLTRHIMKLKSLGYIKKIGYGVWKQLAIYTPCYSTTHPQIRGHNFVFTIKLPKITHWHKKELYLQRHKIEYKKIPQGYRIIVNDNKVWLCNKSIVIYINKEAYGDTAEAARKQLINNFRETLELTGATLGCSFKINYQYQFKISRQHFAKIKDQLAKMYRKKGKQLVVSNKDGIWLITDFSLKVDELETIHPKTAENDMDQVILPFYNTVKQYYDETGRHLAPDLITAHKLYAENIANHIQSIKDLGKGVNELTKIIKQKL